MNNPNIRVTPKRATYQKLLNAVIAVEAAIEEATDIMRGEDGKLVTTLEGWHIETAYYALCSVMVEVDEAIRATEGRTV